MSLHFSKVTLCSAGKTASFLVGGIPKSRADLQSWTVIDNVDTDGEIFPRGRDPRKANFEIKTKGVNPMEKTVFERMGGTYHREGDYLLPNLEAPEAPRIGKYGLLLHRYLRTHKRAILAGLQMSGKLNAHLEQIDREATETEQHLVSPKSPLRRRH